jgi:hypothetical protein
MNNLHETPEMTGTAITFCIIGGIILCLAIAVFVSIFTNEAMKADEPMDDKFI